MHIMILRRFPRLLAALAASALPVLAQNPWGTAITNVRAFMVGDFATGMGIIATVIGGVTFAFGETASKKFLATLILGLGMALFAARFINWLLPGAI